MNRTEIIERGLTVESTGKVLDESGNEYRNEDGRMQYVESEIKIGDMVRYDGEPCEIVDIDYTSDKENIQVQIEFADEGTIWVDEDSLTN